MDAGAESAADNGDVAVAVDAAQKAEAVDDDISCVVRGRAFGAEFREDDGVLAAETVGESLDAARVELVRRYDCLDVGMAVELGNV